MKDLRFTQLPVLFGVLILMVMMLACAKSEKPGAPAPTAVPVPQTTPAPASQPTATSAPAQAPQPSSASLQQPTAAAVDTATIRIDPRSNEPSSIFVQELIKYHHSKLPVWTKAKYGGERLGYSVYAYSASNPLKTYTLGRPNYFGMLFLIDVGTCSLVNRKDYSTCEGVRANNLGGTIVPAIVQKWEQPNPTTIVLTIRQGVLWPAAPGIMTRTDRAVTAEDIRWYFQTQKTEGVYRDTFALVNTIDVVDRFTLKLNFSEPHADFMRMLANAGMGLISKECYDIKGCLDAHIVSPGPYILDEAAYEPRVKSVMNRNPEFYLKGLPYIDRQTGISIADIIAQKAAFISGKLHYFATFTPSQRDLLLQQYPNITTQATTCVCSSAHFEMRLDQALWSDVRVRRAISMGFDRPKVWQAANEGFNVQGMPMAYDYLGLEVPISLKEAGQYYQYNPEAAKKLLAEAGYAQGLKFPVWNYWLTYGFNDQITAIVSDLAKIGVTMEYRQIDSATSANIHESKKWEGLWFSGCYVCAAADSDSYFLAAYSKSPQNYMALNDPKIDDMYLRARKELDPAKRQQILWDFTHYMLDEMYGIHFGTGALYCHFAPQVRNGACHQYAYTNVGNMAGWVLWIDPDLMNK